MPMDKRSATAGAGCLFFFGLPFAGIGVVMIGLLLSSLWTWTSMQSWVEVPAVIRDTDLVENHSDDGTTYRVEATYAYEYEGQTYSGDRVSIHSGSDNIGSFHQDAYRELLGHCNSGKPFRCYVNPRNPSEAVLYRELRLGMIGLYTLVGLLFGGVGFGLMAGAMFAKKKFRATRALQAAYPAQPWVWRDDWRAGVVRSSNRTEMFVSIAAALFWNAVSSPILFFVPGEISNGNWVVLIGLLFPLVGAGLIAWAVRNVLRWRKFGETTFQMAAVPGIVGGPLYGLIRIPTYIRPDEGFHVRLRCVKRVTTGSGKNKSTSEHTVWEREQFVAQSDVLVDPLQAAVPVRMAIPYDAPATDSDSSTPISWKLEVRAAMPGVDYSATFEVPVFKTEASAEDFDETTVAATEIANDIKPERALADAGIRIQPVPGGVEFYFPRAQQKGAVFMTGVILMILAGITSGIWYAGAPLLFPVVFGLFAALILLGFLDQLLGNLRVNVSHGEVRVRGGFLGLGKEQRVSRTDIREVTHKSNMSIGDRRYYQVVLETTDGRKITVGRNIPGELNARGYVAALRRALEP